MKISTRNLSPTQIAKYNLKSDQIRSVAQSWPTLCDPMNRSTPGLPVHHQLPEFTQTHVHRVSDAILVIAILLSVTMSLTLFRFHILVRLYDICLSVSDLFYLAKFPLDSSISARISSFKTK